MRPLLLVLVAASCACRAETRQDAIETAVEKTQAAGEATAAAAALVVGTAGPAAFTPAGAVMTAAVAASPVLAKPLEATAAGIEAAQRAATPRPRSEAMVRFEAAASVSKTKRAIQDLYDRRGERAAPFAAEYVAALDRSASGADEYLWSLLSHPQREMRQAAAARLVSAR